MIVVVSFLYSSNADMSAVLKSGRSYDSYVPEINSSIYLSTPGLSVCFSQLNSPKTVIKVIGMREIFMDVRGLFINRYAAKTVPHGFNLWTTQPKE